MENNSKLSSAYRKKILIKAVIRVVILYPLIGLIIFLPAGTFDYWNGWLFIVALFVPMLSALIYLIITDPELMEKRMKMKESEAEQKLYVKFASILFVIAMVIPGFDHRFQWSSVPVWLVIAATALMIFGYGLFIRVMRENSYASRVIEIQEGQKVIDTGLYSVVRHPMYCAGILIYMAAPIVLGSYYGLIPALFFPVALYFRILNEEDVLKKKLEGYREYMEKVKYRVFPGIW